MNSEGTSEFIEIYRDSPWLWDTSNGLYANRNARKTAQQHLLNVMLKYDNTANLSSVRKKIDSLRSVFFREQKKVKVSESGTGTGADDVYVPNWEHYNELRFLSEVQRPARAGTDSLGTPPASVSSQTTNGSDSKENDEEEIEDCEQNAEKVDGDFRPSPPKVSTNKRMSAQKQLIAAAQKLAEVPAVAPPDKWESYALSVAGDLRMLKDVKQQAIAQKMISDTIFWAKMGRLTEGSSVSLAPSTSPTPTTSVASSPYHITSLHSPSPNSLYSNRSPYHSQSDSSSNYYPSHSRYPPDPFNNSSGDAPSQELDEFVVLRKH